MLKKLFLLLISIFGVTSTSIITGTKLPDNNVIQLVDKPTNSNKVKSSVLIEAKTGKVLVNNRKDLKLPMASMTKVMSLILFFEAIDEGRIKYDQLLTCSEYASSMGGSQIFLSVNELM